MSIIGFIGLGNMGAQMARNLMRSGRKLIVYDINETVLAPFKAEGAEVAKCPADVAAVVNDIITMLPSSPHVKKAYSGDDGILKSIRPGSLCIDSSTIDQSASIEVARWCKNKQCTYVDAPVSGGVTGAENATLTFMVGCGRCQTTFDRASKILKLMGRNVVNCGEVGAGQAAKICNNMLLAVQMIGVSETMNLGIKMGLDSKVLANIINTSSGRCWSSDTYNPVPGVIEGIPPSNGYQGGFGSTLMAKDLSLAQNASTAVQAPTPLGSLAHQMYRLLAQNPEYADKDFGIIYQFLTEQNKTMVGYGNEDENFVIELTYNYGIGSYRLGNDFTGIFIVSDKIHSLVENRSDVEKLPCGEIKITDPDGHCFFIKSGRSDSRIVKVGIKVKDVKRSIGYWKEQLGMKVIEETKEFVTMCYGEEQCLLEIRQLPEGTTLDRASAYGRIAFAYPDDKLQALQKKIEIAKFPILKELVTLDTPGKASVQVVIFADPDEHEICFVGDNGFRELSKIDPNAEEKICKEIAQDNSASWFKGGKKMV
ncbi:3-hydroxyisobutyrate dehydrogenase [Dictyocaulus viviparus]|uniref:3-hydroxyisobutyrate dehydrogenase n=1 Tax=Dictyocaulus viviparus TaxID=29172 RepID=A0A0D8Y8E0_DICVI|nr:3-hydroxyisobutyrate dehydrogenase [Dictyocaulus viviparus]